MILVAKIALAPLHEVHEELSRITEENARLVAATSDVLVQLGQQIAVLEDLVEDSRHESAEEEDDGSSG